MKLPCTPLQRSHARRNTWKWNIFTWVGWKLDERTLCIVQCVLKDVRFFGWSRVSFNGIIIRFKFNFQHEYTTHYKQHSFISNIKKLLYPTPYSTPTWRSKQESRPRQKAHPTGTFPDAFPPTFQFSSACLSSDLAWMLARSAPIAYRCKL